MLLKISAPTNLIQCPWADRWPKRPWRIYQIAAAATEKLAEGHRTWMSCNKNKNTHIYIYDTNYIYIYIYIYMGVSRLSRCREFVPIPLCKRHGALGPYGPMGPHGPCRHIMFAPGSLNEIIIRCSQFAPASQNRHMYYVSAARTRGVHSFEWTIWLIVGVNNALKTIALAYL